MHPKPLIARKGERRSRPGIVECEAETAVFATLGIAAFLAIVLAVVSTSIPSKNEASALSAVARPSIVKYLGSGQLVADARTLASMAQYIMEPESTMVSTASESRRKKSTAVTTNTVAGAPKA